MKERGFSLVEMLVALLILTFSLGALYQAVTGATRNAAVVSDYTHGLLLAQSLLEQYAVSGQATNVKQGVFNDLRWRVETAPIPMIDSSQNLSEIKTPLLISVIARVTWGDGLDRERQIVLQTVAPLKVDQ